MVLDDENDFCTMLKEYFGRKNFDVYVLNSIESALNQIESIDPDYLVLDNTLPDGSGWNLGQNFLNLFPNLFIIFISAFQAQMPRMSDMSRFTILEKPVSLSILDKLICSKIVEIS